MTYTQNLGSTPANLGEREVYENTSIPISRLLDVTIAAGRGHYLEKLTFRKCLIHGPGVIVADPETRFNECDLGDVKGDIRNLFLIAAGPRITGGIFLKGCLFENCVFRQVGFVGSQNYVDDMIRELTTARRAAS